MFKKNKKGMIGGGTITLSILLLLVVSVGGFFLWGWIGNNVDIPFIDSNAMDYCIEKNHTVEPRIIEGDAIKVCNFQNGGWCEINMYHNKQCGED